MTVTAAARGYYDVTSERDETVSYMVMPGKSCTCPHHQCRGAYCKHMLCVDAHLEAAAPRPTALQKAQAVAETLPDAELRKYAAEKLGTPAGAACLLTLARRQAERQPRDWADWPWLDNEPDNLREAEKEAERQPRPIPAGVLDLLVGATDAERARALEIYS